MKHVIPALFLSLLVFFYLCGQDAFLAPKPLRAEPAKETPSEETISKGDIIFKVEAERPKKEKAPPSTTPISEKKTSPPVQQPAIEKKPSPPAQQPAGERKTPTVTESPPKEQEPLQPAPSMAAQSKIQEAAKTPQESLQELLQQAYECMEKDKKYEARNLYSRALLLETSAERRQMLKRHLEELNQALVFSPGTSPDSIVYTVKPGDTLIKIAKAYSTTPELIMRLNRKSSTKILPQESLKILHGKVSLLVDKSDFTLTLLLDGNYIKQYPIGIGRNDKTPEGKFIIENKIKNPIWYTPGGVYPFGHPQNILGTRWLGFQDIPGLTGYGIHGTTEPESIGLESSNGCIRLLNKDVEELFDFVTEGTEVIIQK